jgi:hypothetical protein
MASIIFNGAMLCCFLEVKYLQILKEEGLLAKNHINFFYAYCILLFLAILFAVFYYYQRYAFWEKIKSYHIQTRQVVAVKDITDFDWDKMCVLGPYSIGYLEREEQINAVIKADLNGFVIPDVNDDNKWVFVFVNEGKTVNVAARGFGYTIHKDFENDCLAPETASFYFEQDDLYIRDYLD